MTALIEEIRYERHRRRPRCLTRRRVVRTSAAAVEPAAATAPAKAPVASTARYAANVPSSVLTPDNVETRIGPLKFFDGLPDADTVKKVYDNLDFARGVETFMAGIPATSVQALKNGFIEAGFPPNGRHRHHRESRGRPLRVPDAERDGDL